MYFPVAQAVILSLVAVALTGCQSGATWPWAKKDPAVSQAYPGSAAVPGTAATPGSYSATPGGGVTMPSTQTPAYNVGNNYAPQAAASTTGAGLYPEAAGAAATAYPGSPSAYGTASSYGAGAGATPATAYPSTGAVAAAPQEGLYNSAAAAAPSAYGVTATPTGYGTPAASAYGQPAATGAYPQTASSYPATGAAQSWTPPATGATQSWAPPTGTSPPPSDTAPYAGTASGSPVAQTADSRYSQYNSSAPAANGYTSPAASSAYPATSTPPAAPAAGAYQGSAYPTTPASSTAPSAGAPYRPGGTSDYVPTSQGGSVPSGYGATGSGVHPAGYDEAYSSAPGAAMPAAQATNSLGAGLPTDPTMTR
jgi:hypothetical protein